MIYTMEVLSDDRIDSLSRMADSALELHMAQEIKRLRAERTTGRVLIERVVREEFMERFSAVFSQQGAHDIGESFARRVAERLRPVLVPPDVANAMAQCRELFDLDCGAGEDAMVLRLCDFIDSVSAGKP